jgi:hypothetical protein
MSITADKDKIREWLHKGIKIGATHCLIVCDTWDLWYEDGGVIDFPRYIMPDEDVREVAGEYKPGGIDILREVYNLSIDIEKQLEEKTAMNF